jgi:hypothetical protein
LPILETIRRWGTWWDDPASYVDDWLIGGFLLIGAWLTRRSRLPPRRSALAAAWGFACGMLYPSLAGQWVAMRAGTPDPAPVSSTAVFAIKVMLGLGAVTGLVLALTSLED